MSKKDVLLIFKAAIAAVHPSRLLQDQLSVTENSFVFGGQSFPKSSIRHIYVIGAGKAPQPWQWRLKKSWVIILLMVLLQRSMVMLLKPAK